MGFRGPCLGSGSGIGFSVRLEKRGPARRARRLATPSREPSGLGCGVSGSRQPPRGSLTDAPTTAAEFTQNLRVVQKDPAAEDLSAKFSSSGSGRFSPNSIPPPPGTTAGTTRPFSTIFDLWN